MEHGHRFGVGVFLLLVVGALSLLICYFIWRYYHTVDRYVESPVGVIFSENSKSIFNIKELNLNELKGRVILLNIYNVEDFSYIFSLDIADKLEKRFKNKIVVIDIITNGMVFDKNTIINYIIKNDIKRPAITIEDFSLDGRGVTADRYFVLVDTNGIVVNTFSGDLLNEETIALAIENLIAKHPKLNKHKLNLSLEKDSNPESFVKSLNHIKYLEKIGRNGNGPYFVVADSKARRIYLMTIDGSIVNQIGSGQNGDDDGVGANAKFCYPSGLAVQANENLYVADICNNSIREINLQTLEVATLIKNDPMLRYPIDIEVLNNNLIITTAGDNPILTYDLKNDHLNKVDCEGCKADIIKLVKFDNRVYFISTGDYGLYSIDGNNKIRKEVDFKELNGRNKIKIEGNNNFHVDETGLYFVDKFNNRILKVKDSMVEEYSTNGDGVVYDLPTDIVDYKDKLYITNENSKKLVRLDKNTKSARLMDISFGYEYSKLKFANDEFLNINNIEGLVVNSNGDVKVIINLTNGYSFEKTAPQSLTLYKEDLKNESAILIKDYSRRQILDSRVLDLPKLDDDSIYYLKGTFYYCNYDKETPCLINRYSRKIITSANAENKDIVINFIY